MWIGVLVFDFFVDVGFDDEMMYFLVESVDGYWVCIDVYVIFDVVVVYVCDGILIGEEYDYEMCFIVFDVDGLWMVKGVCVVEVFVFDFVIDFELFEDIFKKF